MIITDKFVFLHLPKTGGTFVADALSLYHGKYLFGPPAKFASEVDAVPRPFCFRSQHKHLKRSQLPAVFRNYPVLGTIRNPLSRYVSQWKYGSWKDLKRKYPDLVSHPQFPDVPFGDFVRMANKHYWLITEPESFLEQSIGWQTASFVQWFSRLDAAQLPAADMDWRADLVKLVIEPITLLDMDNLRQGLHDFLVDMGYEVERLQYIYELPKVVPNHGNIKKRRESRAVTSAGQPITTGDPSDDQQQRVRKLVTKEVTPGKHWSEYYDEELYQFVLHQERLLFELYPEWVACRRDEPFRMDIRG